MFTVTITEKGGEQKRMEFDKAEVTVGRIQGNDIILPKGNVSKRHSRLVLKDGKFIIVDLKSTNGTYVNGRKITSPLVVKGSDKIYIGDYVISIDSAGDDASAGLPGGPTGLTGSMTSQSTSGPASPPSSPSLAASQELPSAAALRKSSSLPPPPPSRQRPGRDSGLLPPQSEVQEAIAELAALGGTVAGEELETSGAPAGATIEMSARETAAVRQARADAQRSSSSLPRLRAEERPASPSIPAPPALAKSLDSGRPRGAEPTPVVGTPGLENGPAGRRHATSPISEQPSESNGDRGRDRAADRSSDRVSERAADRPSERASEPPARAPAAAGRRGVASPAAAAASSEPRGLAARREALARVSSRLELPMGPASGAEQTRVEAAIKEIVESLQLEGLLGESEPATVVREVMREAVGLGPLEELLEDATVDAIYLNQPQTLLVERLGETQRTHAQFSGEPAARLAMIRLAHRVGRSIDNAGEGFELRLANGFAVSGVLGGAAVGGVAAVFRRARPAVVGWADLQRRKVVGPAVVEFLETCVASRRNIFVTGASGSGKTELLGALTTTIPASERVVSVETLGGLYLQRDNWAALAHTGRGDGELIRRAFRMGGSRVVVDGCSGPEAFELVTELSGGPMGALVSIAASNARHCVDRLMALASARSGTSREVIERLVTQAVHVIVQLVREAGGESRIAQIVEVSAGERGLVLNDIFLYRSDKNGARDGEPAHGQLVATGTVPRFYEEIAALTGKPNTSIFRA